jgi:hypothetical protein
MVNDLSPQRQGVIGIKQQQTKLIANSYIRTSGKVSDSQAA